MSDDIHESEEAEEHSHQDESQDEIPQQEVKEVDMHDFNFVAYNEDIAILGSKGSGKSYLANNLLQNLHGINVYVWDFNHQFHDSRSILFHDLDDMTKTIEEAGTHTIHCILQDYNKEEQQFRKFCKFAFNRGNCVLIIDEVHTYCTKQKIIKEYNDLILSGRPRGVSVISISSRPASLPNNVLSNASHVFSFKLNLESDCEFLESYMGSEVWQLMPVDKRKKMRDSPELEKHSFYYRNMDEDAGVIGKI